MQGALIQAVSDVRDGRADLPCRETFSGSQPKLGKIIVTGILLGIAIAIGLVLLIAPGLFLMTIWIAVIPAIVLEDRGIGESFGRSHELVRGNGWNVFGVIVLTLLILIGVSIVVGIVLTPLADWLASLSSSSCRHDRDALHRHDLDARLLPAEGARGRGDRAGSGSRARDLIRPPRRCRLRAR